MYGKQQWTGREVEGRYSDMMTFFVRELGDGIDVENYDWYPHYYFTIEYMRRVTNNELAKIDNPEIDVIREILDTTNCAVTIESNNSIIDSLPPDLFNRCHIIYRIQDTAVQKLKSTDTVSIDAGWYRVHQITKCNMMAINPDNYKYDQNS